ncbi:MAG TPA: apolipoprotein N-acyltransferase [Actinomycetota bacterium]|nr:apolipoprotein N-acyltransferase [Actinomycetota bacterium]
MSRRLAAAGCVVSGVALSFAFPEPSLAPIAWVAVAPLLVLGRRGARHGSFLGFAFGVGFFGALLIWISLVGWIAWFLLVVMEALFLALFGATWAIASRLDRRWWLVAAPALWVSVEALREQVPVVGFPWGQLAQGQVAVPWLLQSAQLGGGKTVSFIVVAVNVLVALAWLERGLVRRAAMIGGAAAVLAAVPFLTVFVDSFRSLHMDGYVLRFAIVQGNARPGVHVEDQRARVMRHARLTEDLAGEDLDLVVWPESSVGIDPFRDQEIAEMIAGAARAVDAPMIVGANLDVDPATYQVVALLVSADGEIVDLYQKTHLVPFGEYVPVRGILGGLPMLQQIPRDAVAGDSPKNFLIGRTEVAVAISFEGDFGPLVRDRIADGGRALVVATNTSTWGYSWASAQHVAMSQVRAAENQVPVIHAALSGISAFVSPFGLEAHYETDLYEEEVVVASTRAATQVSLYARTGEWLPWSCVIGGAITLLVAVRRGRRDTVTVPG